MGTLRIENESEIREMVADCLMPDVLADYAAGLAEFFWEKAMALLKAFGDERAQADVRGKYKEWVMDRPEDKYVVIEALEDHDAARRLAARIPASVESIVKEIMANPMEVACDDPDDENAVEFAKANLLSAFLNAYGSRFEKDAHASLGALRGHSYGFNEEEYRDLLRNYDVMD